MLKSDDVPLNMDDLCSTMGADSAPSNFSSGFLLPDRVVRPTTASRQERQQLACMALSVAPRTEVAPPRVNTSIVWQRVACAGSSCMVTVLSPRSHGPSPARHKLCGRGSNRRDSAVP